MPQLFYVIGFILFFTFQTFASDVKVILTGNTADLPRSGNLFTIIDQYCKQESAPVLWVLNGDLFSDSFSTKEVEAWNQQAGKLLDQYPHLQILINQGDRDWNHSGKKGWKKVQELEKELKKGKHDRVHVFLKKGCPGPWTFSVSPFLDVVIINSQWWNHPYEKPIASMDVCTVPDEGVFLEELTDYLDENENKNVLLLSHFPLTSLGKYGGRFPVSAYLFPPLLGNALTSFHQHIGTREDIANEHFDAIRHKLNDILLEHSSLIFASGHERNHSILQADQNFYINSGALVAGDFVTANKLSSFASSEDGFLELTYHENSEVSYQFFSLSTNQLSKGQQGILLHSSCKPEQTEPHNTAYQPCKAQVVPTESTTGSQRGVAQAQAGAAYKARKFKALWLGKHYRDSWTATVKAPYLNMDTTCMGLEIKKKGGGRQTTSLQMIAGNGKEYVFRSVDKDPSKALDYALRGTLVSDVFQDQTTTQQPYGAMPVGYLLNKLDILHANPTLYVLPPGEALGSWKDYGNLFGMLEDRPSDKIEKDKIFGGADDIEKSHKLFEKLYNDHDNRIDQTEFCRARVFDIWIGDWSKHEDNWKWAGYKEKGGELFRPIPRDRDHAFSRWDGILPWLADREWAKPSGENFDYTIAGLHSLMWQARHLDRFVGNALTKTDWINAAKEIQAAFSDQDIEAAIQQMPAAVYDPDGKAIEAKLKARLKDLPGYAEQFYYILSKQVDVVGSNKAEYFHALRNQDGSVNVSVYDLNKKNQQPIRDRIYYKRTFYTDETKEIRLFGLKGDDMFVIEGEADKSILIRVISGGGKDHITDRSVVKQGGKKTLIYEKNKDTIINPGTEARQVTPKEDRLYDYDRTVFAYNTYLPIVLISYNTFTGVALQGGITFTRQHFSKPDFSAKHKFRAAISTEGNYEFSYGNQLRYLIGRWDGLSEFRVSRPLNYNYFFGIGNATNNESERDNDYYRTQYNAITASVGLTRQFWKKSNLTFTANYELDEGITRDNSFLADHLNVFGTDQLSLFFIKGNLNLDFRDAFALPERGFRLQLTQHAGHISDSEDDLAFISELEIEQYLSTYTRNPITVGIRLGGGLTNGQLPFYKLLSLGQLNDLHGFKTNRFTGESKAFLNTELRWQLAETKNTFIPVKMGIRGFFDVGKVWAATDQEIANFWHRGYGAGFYVAPFSQQFTFNLSAGFSNEEDMLLMFGLGSFFK